MYYFPLIYIDFRFFLTIGFGDFYPATEAGRPIFIVYALLAVPTMTIIGNSQDLLQVNGSTNRNVRIHIIYGAAYLQSKTSSLQRKGFRDPISEFSGQSIQGKTIR